MAKTRDLRGELTSLEERLMQCFQRTFPSKQFRAEMMLGVISLELTLKQLSRARDLGERRKLTQEFDHGLEVIGHGIRLLWESRWGVKAPPEPQTPESKAAQMGGLFHGVAPSPPVAG